MADVTLRPLEPGDRWTVAAVFDRLSDGSRALRFHGPKPRLTERDLASMTAVDHRDHEALVADDDSGRPVALGELVRDRRDPALAEIAFAVADEWQGRGVGTLLTDALAERAKTLGIRRLRASVLPGNARALALVRRLGHVVATRFDGYGYEYDVELPAGS